MFIYFWVRQSQNASGLGAEREETQNRKQAPVSELSAQSPARGSTSQSCEVMTWAEVRHSTDWATQAPPERLDFRYSSQEISL